MKQNRKETAWKKNRKFGDVKGGRMRPKLADQVFNRQHNFLPPTEDQETPIYITENPSRDFFFPIDIEDIKGFLLKLPEEHTENLTHIWLRKIARKQYEKGEHQGSFICGGKINLVVLYPFPKDLMIRFGKKKPEKSLLKWYSAYGPELSQINGNWILKWTEKQIKQYYLEGLLLHEIGHQMDSYYQRYWSKAYKKRKSDQFADNYAYYWGNRIRTQID